MLAPAPPDDMMQFIDARDLARFTLDMAQKRATEAYNATGIPHMLIDILETCKQVSGSDAKFTWVDASFLLENEIQPFTDLPLWIPAPETAGLHLAGIQKALDAGLIHTPLEDTIRNILEWERSREDEVTNGLSRERESELLKKWHEKQG